MPRAMRPMTATTTTSVRLEPCNDTAAAEAAWTSTTGDRPGIRPPRRADEQIVHRRASDAQELNWNAGRSARGAYQGSGGLCPQSVGHGVVNGEDLGETCDAKHFQDPLLGTHQLQRTVVRSDPVQ